MCLRVLELFIVTASLFFPRGVPSDDFHVTAFVLALRKQGLWTSNFERYPRSGSLIIQLALARELAI